MALAIVLLLNEQSASGSCGESPAQDPTESLRSAMIVALKAVPTMPLPFRAAAATSATWVP